MPFCWPCYILFQVRKTRCNSLYCPSLTCAEKVIQYVPCLQFRTSYYSHDKKEAVKPHKTMQGAATDTQDSPLFQTTLSIIYLFFILPLPQ